MFSYNISRRFPGPWFSLAIFTVCVFGAVIFTLLNYVVYGFELVTISTHDPNSTLLAEQIWTQNWPWSSVNKAVGTFQPYTLFVNSVLYTNSTSLPYTVTGIWQDGPNGPQAVSSLAYYNNVLLDCDVKYIQVDIDSGPPRNALQIGGLFYGPKATVRKTSDLCSDE